MSTMILHNMCCAFHDADPADLVGSQNNPLGANFMRCKQSTAFAKVPVGDQQGLCQLCERKGRHVCRHGLHQVFALRVHMAETQNVAVYTKWPHLAYTSEKETSVDGNVFDPSVPDKHMGCIYINSAVQACHASPHPRSTPAMCPSLAALFRHLFCPHLSISRAEARQSARGMYNPLSRYDAYTRKLLK
eukprot:2574326-Rhodomonas_salina.1